MKTLRTTRRAARAGFTLAEIMVVILIIGLLATFVVPALFSKVDKAKVTTAKQHMTTIKDAVINYKLNNGSWPDNLEQLTESDSRGNAELNSVPKDPWKGEYALEIVDNKPVVWCYGADQQQGGQEQDADFSTAMIEAGEI